MENRIKKEREILGWSQEKLSLKSGVARTIISGLESGRVTTTTTGTLDKIASALGKTIKDVFF